MKMNPNSTNPNWNLPSNIVTFYLHPVPHPVGFRWAHGGEGGFRDPRPHWITRLDGTQWCPLDCHPRMHCLTWQRHSRELMQSCHICVAGSCVWCFIQLVLAMWMGQYFIGYVNFVCVPCATGSERRGRGQGWKIRYGTSLIHFMFQKHSNVLIF